MLSTIRQFSNPPIFPDDEDKTRTAQVLSALLRNMLLLLLLSTLGTIFVFVNKTTAIIVILFLLAWVMLSHALLHRGRVLAASRIFLAGAWLTFTLAILLTGRITTAFTSLQLATTVMAGVLLGRRSAITLTLLSAIVGLGLAILEQTGYPLIHYFPAPPLVSWIVWALAFILILVPMNSTLQSITQSLTRARESEARLRSLGDNLPGGMIYQLDMGKDGQRRQFTYVSAGVETLHEVTAEAVLQDAQQLYGHVAESDRQRIAMQETQAQVTMSTFKTEVRVQLPSGADRWSLLTSAPRRAPNGHLVWDGIEVDITERKQAEEALRHERDLLERLMATSPVGITVVDREGHITFANQHAEQALGLTKEQITERTYNAPTWHITDDDGRPFPNKKLPFSQVMATGQPVHDVRHAIEWPDGRRVLLSINASPLFNDAGQLDGMMATIDDITERVRAERILQESAARFHAMFEEHGAIMLLIEPDSGQILDVNTAAEQFYGHSRETLKEMTIQDINILPPEEVAKRRRQALDQHLNYFVFPHRLASGEVRTVEVHSTPIPVGGKRILFSIIHDITERKQMEMNLKAALEEAHLRQKEIAALLEASQTIPFCRTFEVAARKIFDICKALIGARSGYVALLSEDGAENEVLFLDAGGLPCDVDPALPMPIRGLREVAYRTKDVAYDNDFADSEWVRFMPPRHMMLENVLFAPLDIQNETVGLMGMANKPGGFTDRDTKMAQAFGDLAAVALTYAEYQDELRESEERLSAFMDSASDHFYILDSNLNFVEMNRNALALIGKEKADVLGKNIADIVPDVKQSGRYEKHLSVIRTGESFSIEDFVPHPIFGDKYFVLTSFKVGDGLGVIAHDITERKKAEQALRASEERLRQVVENMPVMMNAFDEDLKIIVWNRECERVTGYSAAEIVGNPHSLEMLYPDTTYREQMIAESISLGWNYRDQEWTLTGKDGEQKTISWFNISRQFPIPSWHTWAIGVDVTERKQLEEQFRQAQKMEAIGRLAGGIAHDFNNILVPIIGYVDLVMLDLTPDDMLYDDLKQVREAAERAKSLTRQILAFSRQQVLEMCILDLNTLVADFEKMIQRLIGEDIELQTFLDPALHPVKADKGQIEQVLLNLVVNARDAMPTGGELTIETANVYLDEAYVRNHADIQAPGHFVRLTVRDTGCGMDAETQQHIFEPFFTTKVQGKGTGLGLATVFGIVKQHKGNIWMDSEPGSGTTFKIYLPRAEETVQIPGATATELTSAYGTETILITEDEEMVLKLIDKTLTAHGYKILKAQSPLDALKVASEYKKNIHLLMTDVVMPEMNGGELYQNITSIYPDIKVLYMSGYTDDVVIHHGILEEGVNFLQKPFTVQSLTQKVRQALC